MGHDSVEAYIDDLEGWQREVATTLDALIRRAAPNASASIKWSQPVYAQGGVVAYFKAFKNHLNFGFWRGALLDDPNGLLEGGEVMRHVKLRGPDDVNAKAFEAFVKQAVKLNAEHGDPTARAKKK